MTVTLDDRTEIFLHPLDLSTYPPSTSSSSSCIGLIQTYPVGSSVGNIADIILGVPFMRSAYTVMAYDAPDSQGNFPNASSPATSAVIRPRLGLLGLTDPAVANEEFHTVRVLNQPLKTSDSGSGSGSKSGVSNASTVEGRKLSVGVEVLIGLVGFFALCFVLFGARWIYAKRKFKKMSASRGGMDMTKDSFAMEDVAYRLARRSSKNDPYGASDETLRSLRYSELKRRKELMSDGTMDSARTRVNLDDVRVSFVPKDHDHKLDHDHDEEEYHDEGDLKKRRDMEMGYVRVQTHNRSDSEGSDPATASTNAPFSPGWDKESLFSTLASTKPARDGPYPNPPPLPSTITSLGALESVDDGSRNRRHGHGHSGSMGPRGRMGHTMRSRSSTNINSHYLDSSRSSISPPPGGLHRLHGGLPSSATFPGPQSQSHLRTASGEPGPSMPLLAHTRSDSHLSRLAGSSGGITDNRGSGGADGIGGGDGDLYPFSPPAHISEFGEFAQESSVGGPWAREGRPGSGVAGIGSGSGVRRGSGLGLFSPPPGSTFSIGVLASQDSRADDLEGEVRLSAAESVATVVAGDIPRPQSQHEHEETTIDHGRTSNSSSAPPPPLHSSDTSSLSHGTQDMANSSEGTNQGRGPNWRGELYEGSLPSNGAPGFLPQSNSGSGASSDGHASGGGSTRRRQLPPIPGEGHGS